MAPPDRSDGRLGTVAPAAVVLLLFALLVVVAGAWPPFVAVESGSMEPHLERGDLVLLTATDRFAPPHATDAGVVTSATASTYRRLGAPGDVIVFAPPSRDGSPVIHRAAFRVERGENWYDEADPDALPASVNGCDDLAHCPAPHAGYVTKGDANGAYDQAGRFTVVRDARLRGKAQVAIPWVGHLRLLLAGA
ncbi:S26 family signal peptidase [Salinigranum marinum]|uniref:S26 family signal peptidase n=1 Tax=Salinigranum marinum TaxID=1515595 RepID=UPI002989C029|nr:S26 family signal peptidase [Salinigranum marinum]